ncbi:hypothetical protein GpartN1_g1658.t1 [Galdieria partita]|uniref:NusG-like N-terminal domain-containing protein n=1 Tax=Galdieria partita TaxID=83374 RepID=A0A9C7PUI2_9RHOD|nr:hypothetical protein GpartN1_g1658.t1 [Galdieria partita]
MLNFAAFIKLDRTVVPCNSFQVSGCSYTLAKKPISRTLCIKRSLRPVFSNLSDKVKVKTVHTRICICSFPSYENSSDESGPSVYRSDLRQGFSDNNETAGEERLERASEDAEAESVEESFYGDDAAKNVAPKWYLLQVTRGRERAVRDTLLSKAENSKILRDRLLNVVVPCAKKVVLLPSGIPKVRMEPFFSGYVLVKLILTDSAYRSIKQTLFVVGFVSFGNKGKRKSIPEPIRDSEVEEILRKVEVKYPESDVAFSVGDKVQVLTSETNAYGIVSEIGSSNEYVKVACLLQGSAGTVEAKVESLRFVKDEEFEVAVKEYTKSRQAKPRQTKKKNDVSSETLVSVLSKNNEGKKDVVWKATSNASEIDIFIDDLEQEEKERQKRRAKTENDPNDEVIPVSGQDSYLLTDELFLGDVSTEK